MNNASVHLDEKPTFIRAELPKGSFGGIDVQQPSGGFSGIATGGFTPSETIKFSYDVRFPTDFPFGRGGFLPCIYGGRTTTKINFSCALAWDKNGKFALYTTFPNMANDDIYASTTSTPLPIDGQWHTITIEGSMNSPTKGNGTLKISLDGEGILTTTKAMFRTKNTDTFEGISFDAFYRGRNAAVQDAAPADTYIDFTHISLKSK